MSNKGKFECGLGFHEYTIPGKTYPHVLICEHCKRFGHSKSSYSRFEYWVEYDDEGNEIHFKNDRGYECWTEYDNKGNRIYYKTNNGIEEWLHNGNWTTKKPVNWEYENEQVNL